MSPYKSDCVEITLIKMFDCEEMPSAAEFEKGKDYIGKMMDCHFKLGISEKAARKLVEKINQRFNSNDWAPATFIRAGAKGEKKKEI